MTEKTSFGAWRAYAGVGLGVRDLAPASGGLDEMLDSAFTAYGGVWEDAAGIDSTASGRPDEAIWRTRILLEGRPEEPEVHALLALMLYCEARRPARQSADGRFVPAQDQDPKLWNASLIAEAEWLLESAARFGRIGRFQLEAAIQSVHAERAQTGRTDWHAIARFYERLVTLSPTVVTRVARASAVAHAEGPSRALELLAQIDRDSAAECQPYWTVRGDVLKDLNRYGEAVEAFDHALGLVEDRAVRRQLLERLSEISRWLAVG